MVLPAATTAAAVSPGSDNPLTLVGKGDRLLGLVLAAVTGGNLPRYQWAQWLRLPLASAAADGDALAVEELLQAGADGKAGPRGPDGATLLHCAAKGGSEQVVKALLHAGSIPDVNQPVLVENEERPLHIAAKAGHSAAAAALIGAGASVDCRDRNGWTPLALAARFGRIEVVTLLLREGADRDAEDANGYHPLHYATMWSHTTTISALVEAGAALESATRIDGNRPLHIAARYASEATVQHLLRQGADKDAQNSRGFTALHAAAASNKVGAISLLLAEGASVDLPSGQQGFTPLHLAARNGRVEACSALLSDGGARIDARAIDGSTPLHLACAFLKAPAARLLLRCGADETARNAAGQTPADVAGRCLPAGGSGGGGKGGENCNRSCRELVVEIQNGLQSATADRAWTRRGWLVMARARVLRSRRMRCTDDGGGSKVEHQVKADNDGGKTRSGVADAATVATMTAACGLGSGKRARRSDGGVVADGASKPDEKKQRLRAAAPADPETIGEGGDPSVGGGDTSASAIFLSPSELVARVAGIEEDEIFQNILSFL